MTNGPEMPRFSSPPCQCWETLAGAGVPEAQKEGPLEGVEARKVEKRDALSAR